MFRPPPTSTPCPYTTLFRSRADGRDVGGPVPPPPAGSRQLPDRAASHRPRPQARREGAPLRRAGGAHAPRERGEAAPARDRKSTRLNSSHLVISYAVFWLKK